MDRLDTHGPHTPTMADALAQRATSCFAALRLLMPDATSTPWLPACYQLTARVEVVSSSLVLLDLGHCTPEEGLSAAHSLRTPLNELAPSLRIGLAPSLTLAQLALAQTTPARPLRLLTSAEAPAFLQRLPVSVLADLHPQRLLPQETIARLQRYGLRTLGQVANLGDAALRQQFGAEVGGALMAMVTGRDPRPLCPTPPPPTVTLRLRVPDGALPPAQVASLLPLLAAQATTLLHQARVQAQALRLTVRWDGSAAGTRTEASTVLSQPTDEHAPLTSALRRLLEQLVAGQCAAPPRHHSAGRLETAPEPPLEGASAPALPAAIAGLRLTLGELHPLAPATQRPFWRTRAQTLAATAQVAETLTVRYGRVLLTRPCLAVPAAIFHEERYRLTTRDATPDDAAETTETASIADAVSASPPSPDAPWRQVLPRLHWG